jgi:hypothetical protein
MSPQYYNADVFAMNFEGRRVSFARLLLRLLGARCETPENASLPLCMSFRHLSWVVLLTGYWPQAPFLHKKHPTASDRSYANFAITPFGRSSRGRESLHSPAPIGRGRRRGDAHIVGYYVLVYADIGADEGLGIGVGQSEESEPL